MSDQVANVYEVTVDETVTRDGRDYQRVLARTPWFEGPTDLASVFRQALGSRLESGAGTAFVTEKVAVVALGATVDASTVKVGRIAKVAAKFVRPLGDDVSQNVPTRWQFVANRIGMPRFLFACLAAGVTRPFGVRGTFYKIAGPEARDLDGMHGRYAQTLVPRLAEARALEIVNELASELGTPVAIVDVNDRSGTIRAVSRGGLPAAELLSVLSDNPMGQRYQSTPVGWIRPL